jgi:hypothetical protein
MQNAEQRAILKRLQSITNNRGDSEVDAVLSELREALDAIGSGEAEPRQQKSTRDRKERVGRDRGTA